MGSGMGSDTGSSRATDNASRGKLPLYFGVTSPEGAFPWLPVTLPSACRSTLVPALGVSIAGSSPVVAFRAKTALVAQKRGGSGRGNEMFYGIQRLKSPKVLFPSITDNSAVLFFATKTGVRAHSPCGRGISPQAKIS
jgi:hypothetical protein